MRTPVIAGNWKMNMTCEESRLYLSEFLPLIATCPKDREIVIAPLFTALSTLSQITHGQTIELSSQNVHWEGKGAFTAEISPSMLLEHNVAYAIVGHS